MTQTIQFTDQELQDFVTEQLRFDPSVEGKRVTVTAHGGTVKLSGETMSFSEKVAVRESALGVRGVTAVIDEISVRTPIGDPVSDSDLAEAATKMLGWSADVPIESVKASVHGHIVTLSGSVAWNHQREAAVRAVTHLRGVTGVRNSIAIYQPSTTMPEGDAVTAAIQRCAELDARTITVEVRGHELVLQGEVGSFAEYGRAERIAWAAPGVTKVSNNLHVTL